MRAPNLICACLTLVLVIASTPARAGGPRAVTGAGDAFKWDSSLTIVYNPDRGPLGQLDNTDARALLREAFDVWEALGLMQFSEGRRLPFDIDAVDIPATNPAHYLHFWREQSDVESDLDIVLGIKGGRPSQTYLNIGSGAFPDSTDVGITSESVLDVAVGDIDKDGDRDLVLGIDGVSQLFLNNGTAKPWEGVTGIALDAFGYRTEALALADVDQDGDLDLVAGNDGDPSRYYENNGSGFEPGVDITADVFEVRDVALGDVNGDGYPDLVVVNQATGDPERLYLNNTTSTPWNPVTVTNVAADAPDGIAVQLHDVDGDDDLDMVVGTKSTSRNIKLYLNDENPANNFNFTNGVDVGPADSEATYDLALADVDGDGDVDLIAGNQGVNRLYLSDGSTDPWGGLSAGLLITSDSGWTHALAVGDADADGDLDLVAGNDTGASFLYSNDGAGDPWDTLLTGTPIDSGGKVRGVGLADVGRDYGRAPVIFDADGTIIDDLFGTGARFEVLGISGLDLDASATSDPLIPEASILINGAFYDGIGLPDSPPDVPSREALKAVVVHEIGHFLNLDHSILNHELGNDGNIPNDVYLPTMYPVASDDLAQGATLHLDDQVALRGLYDTSLSDRGVTGQVLQDGTSPFQGAQVVLRSTNDPLATAVSVFSGAHYFPCNPGSPCYPCTTPCDPCNPGPCSRGDYTIEFMPDAEYELCVSQPDLRFSLANGTFLGPLATPPITPGPDECYDTAETDNATDDPDDAETLNLNGTPTIDILINGFPSTDPFEPPANDTLSSASTLPDLLQGADSEPAVLTLGDLDVYAIPVTAGDRLRIDIDAGELGSGGCSDGVTLCTEDAVCGGGNCLLFDPTVAIYNGADQLIQVVDDSVDPETGMLSIDPAMLLDVAATDTLRLVVSSYPDSFPASGLDANTGSTFGAYWIRVEFDGDADNDGVPDSVDVCPELDDPGQEDFDGDRIGDRCDDDDDNDGLSDEDEQNGTTGQFDPDSDDDGVIDGVEVDAGSIPTDPNSVPGGFAGGGSVVTTLDGAWRVFAADVDGDGDSDLLVGAKNANKAVWFENLDGLGTFGTENPISAGDNQSVVWAADIDRDGDVDVIATEPSGPDGLAWYRNSDGRGTFVLGQIVSSSHRWDAAMAFDLDGDGDLDLLCERGPLVWFENLDGAGNFGAEQVIDSDGDRQGAHAADVDGDGDLDVVTVKHGSKDIYWLQNDGTGSFGARQYITQDAAGPPRGVLGGDVDGDGDVDVVYGSDQTGWFENTDGLGTFGLENPIGNKTGRFIELGDIDLDGDLDLLGVPDGDDRVLWFENTDGTGTFGAPRVVVAGRATARAATLVDVDRDGNPDVASADEGRDEIAWHQSVAFPRAVAFGAAEVATNATVAPEDLHAADLDADGAIDLLSASSGDDRVAWYVNTDGQGTFGPQQVIDAAALGAIAVAAGDLNRDGDIDVIAASASDNTLAWHPNQGGSFDPMQKQVISSSESGAAAVEVTDIDRDGTLDVLVGSDTAVNWYRNDPPGTFGAATGVFSGLSTTAAVVAADIDGDGDDDVVSASSGDDTVAWYENDAAVMGRFSGSRNVITTAADGASDVFAADLDRDGDIDVLTASANDDTVAWYENDGAGAFGAARILSDGVAGASAVRAVDLDRDGDYDVVAASATNDEVVWFEHIDGTGGFEAAKQVADDAGGPSALFAADVDRDGDDDVLSAAKSADSILMYRNGAGQYRFFSADVAPAQAPDAARFAAISIPVRLRTGATATATASTLDFLLSGDSGPPLTSAEANALIDELAVYRDEGSGLFEAADDTLAGSVSTLSGGLETIDLSSASPTTTQMRSGEINTFFLVVTMTSDASQQGLSGFSITHVKSSSVVLDGATARPLRQELSADVPTKTINVAGPDTESPEVLSVFPSDGAIDVALSSDIVLVMDEAVDPLTATADTVSVDSAGVKVPGVVTLSDDGKLIGFDPQGLLEVDTDYTVRLSDRVTDLAGNPAVAFASTFDTTEEADAGSIGTDEIGDASSEEASGSSVGGSDQDDNAGLSVAMVGDVNDDGTGDLLVGAPNADGSALNTGEARLVFGSPDLQSNSSSPLTVVYSDSTSITQDQLALRVSRAGDLGCAPTTPAREDCPDGATGDTDDIDDFLIGAPNANGTAGTVYVVFGHPDIDQAPPTDLNDLAACSTPKLCGVKISGAATDEAGAAIAFAGDINDDGYNDLLIGAPGAEPVTGVVSGAVYLLYGPLAPGTINLTDVGSTQAGLVFHGEGDGDRAGEAISWWEDDGPASIDGIDDLLIGAPGATVFDEFGSPVSEAGLVYAVHGGAGLDDGGTGIIELSRIANGLTEFGCAPNCQVPGTVFLGTRSGGKIGRSVTGAVDLDDDGVKDVVFGSDGEVWSIPGKDPKTLSGSSRVRKRSVSSAVEAIRLPGSSDVQDQFQATVFSPGADGALGPLTVGGAGDVNDDGIEDFLVGAPLADPGGRTDAGKVYIVYGSGVPEDREVLLSDIGGEEPGLTLEGAADMDELGCSVDGGIDVNADGVDDGIAGAPFADPTDEMTDAVIQNAGETYVISPASPEEVKMLTLEKIAGSVRLEWSIPDRALAYNVYRGLFSTVQAAGMVRTSDLTQLACGITTNEDGDQLPDTTDPAVPPAGDGYLYIVSGKNLTGEGPIAPDGATPPRVNDLQCP
jgi:hypothetical protein